ncbi:unnamed protein product, partial [Rotaria sp. Silwood2]
MEMDLVIRIWFFVRDLHNHIADPHFQQFSGKAYASSFTVYRGQELLQTHFNQMFKTKDGLLSFNNFLSTCLNQEVSIIFAESNL